MATTSLITYMPSAGRTGTESPNPQRQPIAVQNRVRVASKAEYIQTVLGSLDVGMVLIDHDGRVEWVSPAATRILRGQAEELFGGDAITADGLPVCHIYGRDPVAHPPSAQTIRTGRPVSGRVVGVDLRDGQLVWLSVKCCLLDASDQLHPVLLVSFTSVAVERDQSAAA